MKRWILAVVLWQVVPVMADGDAVRGKALYETNCAICHGVDESKIGPAHRGVVGRKAGVVKGFAYSSGFANANIVWNDKTLDAWIAFPENLVPGQKMGFYVAEAPVRADIIAYLKTLKARD